MFLFRAISVDTFENRLWGLDMDHKIVRHEVIILYLLNQFNIFFR